MSRREVAVQIRAWLEAREIVGFRPAFRARVRVLDDDRQVGVSSRAALHRELDRILADALGDEEDG